MYLRRSLAILCVPVAVALIGASGRASSLAEAQTAGGPVSTAGTPTPTSSTSGTPTTSTSGTPTTSTSGGTGTTSGSTGTALANGFSVSDLVELKSATIWKRSGSSTLRLTDQHAVRVKVNCPIQSPVPAPPTGYTYYTTLSNIAGFGDTVFFDMGDGTTTPVSFSDSPGPTDPLEGALVHQTRNTPTSFYVGLASSGALGSGKIRFKVSTAYLYRKWDPPSNNYITTSIVYEAYAKLDLAKLSCDDASIDTRRGHGQPNLQGELPGDPNAPARPVNFGGWTFKGGLFAGNMPFTSGDQSGTARLQLYVPSGGIGDALLATLSLYDLGSPGSAYPPTLGVLLPTASDANLNVGAGAVTWDTRWLSIQPRTSPPGSPDDSKDPFSVRLFSGTGGEYSNFALGRGGGIPPAMALSRISIGLTDEDPNSAPSWRYFSSKEYQGVFSTFPLSDSAPRVWRLGAETVNHWIY